MSALVYVNVETKTRLPAVVEGVMAASIENLCWNFGLVDVFSIKTQSKHSGSGED